MSASPPSSERRPRKPTPERPPLRKVKTKGKEEATKIVNGYKRPVFMDREGKMKMEEVELKYEDGIKPVQPARKLEAEGVVEHEADPT